MEKHSPVAFALKVIDLTFGRYMHTLAASKNKIIQSKFSSTDTTDLFKRASSQAKIKSLQSHYSKVIPHSHIRVIKGNSLHTNRIRQSKVN